MEAMVDANTITDVIDVLSHMKRQNGAVTEDFIHGPSEFEVREQNIQMPLLSKSLRRLRASRDLFQILLKIYDSKIDVIENKCTPYFLKKGIKSLPDDVLRHVFEVGYEEEDIRECTSFSTHVSSISRRFRRVALESPRIWTRLHNYMSRKLLRLLISRSKDAGIHIHLTDLWYPVNDGLEFMRVAVSECRRWETFMFHFTTPQIGLSTCQTFSNLNLPRLSTLSLRCSYYDATESEVAGSIASIWTLPSVRYFTIHNANINGTTSWTSLSSFDIILDNLYEEDKWDMWQVLRGVGGMPSLESLSLHFIAVSGFDTLSGMESFRLTVPNLRTLTYIFECCDPELVLTPLLGKIILPGLLNLKVEFRGCEIDSGIWVGFLFEGSNPYPSLRNFALKQYDSILNECELDMVQNAVPSLKHVSLEGLCTYVSPPDPGHSWETLRINHLDYMDEETITSIAETLMEDPAFKRLDIIRCRRVSLRCLMALKARMGSKLFYEL